MLSRLSDLLRMTLDNAGTQEVRLKEELEFLEQYVEIERARFGTRLTVDIDVDPDLLDARVPNLLLQPLVENAVRHGVAPRTQAGWIGVSAVGRDGRIEIAIEDDGPGIPAQDRDRVWRNGSGIGLSNCRARLEQLYGERASIELGSASAGGLRVSVSIPHRSFVGESATREAASGGENSDV